MYDYEVLISRGENRDTLKWNHSEQGHDFEGGPEFLVGPRRSFWRLIRVFMALWHLELDYQRKVRSGAFKRVIEESEAKRAEQNQEKAPEWKDEPAP